MSKAWLGVWVLAAALAGGCADSGLSGAPSGGVLPQADTGVGEEDADAGATDGSGGSGGGGATDGVGADATAGDAGATDSGTVDTATADAGSGDTALPDITAGDAGSTDGAIGDGAATDGGDLSDAADAPEPGDAGGADADTEEPGACETDEDCTFLTAKACCPEPQGPCGDEPEVGNLSDQDEIIAWIAQTCDPTLPCDPIDPPDCEACYVVETLAPVCDAETKKCALARALDCASLCAAKGDPDAGTCPAISDPTLFTPDNLDDCGCP